MDILIIFIHEMFGDLDNRHVPEWLVTPLDMKIDNKGYESDLEDDLIEMREDLEAKALSKSKNLMEYWSNNNTATKNPKLRAAADPFLLTFPTSWNIGAISILLLRIPSSEQQPILSYLHSQLHGILEQYQYCY